MTTITVIGGERTRVVPVSEVVRDRVTEVTHTVPGGTVKEDLITVERTGGTGNSVRRYMEVVTQPNNGEVTRRQVRVPREGSLLTLPGISSVVNAFNDRRVEYQVAAGVDRINSYIGLPTRRRASPAAPTR